MAGTIGILTAGGDSPGLNAAIRGVVARATAAGADVIHGPVDHDLPTLSSVLSRTTAWIAGTVTKQGSRKAVVVPSLDLTFEGDSLQLR